MTTETTAPLTAPDDAPPAPRPGTRCFGDGDQLYEEYHDTEWAVPVHGDTALFERLVLEGFQSGLSWITVLRKRPAFREAFAGFDPAAVAAFGEPDVERLLGDARIIRNRQKITATIDNARALLALQESGRTLDELIWSFAPPPRRERPAAWGDVPGLTPESTALSKTLKKQGFRFVGPTTAYATMQACGLVDDHLATCPVALDAPGRTSGQRHAL
ncbi:DNA-3-methyladenine glycosylase I [Cellulosimicrobium cellulans]|uniref:DNA-3-methyladenine glycosylase I n=1 Tax=Cellulosimicrobium cellulans TaxID=1710 RepID=UPI002404A76C|nr:DNA-3-methyladenine glycosylase I [Cellulosimicrobium cellulans]MDF9877055.1 DNA-3-methyladenine glycosylase I [Cellulosimicrobium cellulans]